MLRKITREPLVHFIVAGFLLFIYFRSCSSGGSYDDQIVVSQEGLLSYMQYQSKAFNQDVFIEKFAAFSEQERQELIDRYIQDEVLYREAIALGLDQNDFVIKRRIIQKMEFILDDFDASQIDIHQDSLEVFFEGRRESYFQSELYTLTHIYFKQEDRVAERVEEFMSQGKLDHLSASESLPYGDRFLYHRNYNEKTSSFLEGHFGQAFIDELSKLPADQSRWQGPIQSEHGLHMVLLLKKNEAQVPELSEIRSVVESDYMSQLKQLHKQKKIDKLIQKYEPVNDL